MVPTLLEIGNVHVLSGDGQALDFRRIRCPAHGRTVNLEACLSCTEHGGIERGPAGRIEYATCRHAGAGTDARHGDPPAWVDPTPVSDVMTADVFAVRPDVSLESVVDVMLERGYGGVPVVDDEGRPVGVVSKTDVLDRRFVEGDTGEAVARGWQASRGRYRVQLGPGVHAQTLPSHSVAEAMTRVALTVREDAPVSEAAALMATRGIHRVLVVSDDGRLSGIVTANDIMRWLAQQAGRLPADA